MISIVRPFDHGVIRDGHSLLTKVLSYWSCLAI